MYDLSSFRERVRSLYRSANPYDGRRPTQADLAEAIGLHRTELSNRLHGVHGTHLTTRDVHMIVRTLAEWEAITTQAEALELLTLADCPPFSAAQWQAPPLNLLTPALPAYTTLRHPLVGMKTDALPLHATSFVGRERELHQVQQLLGKHRLVTIVGTGGTGKTRLAIEVARRVTTNYQHGSAFVALDSLSDPALILPTIARSLGITDRQGQWSSSQVMEWLLDRQMLLVIDNCEHLIEPVAKIVEALILAGPRLHIIATSREPLRIPGEVSWRIPTLSLPRATAQPTPATLQRSEAFRLFAARAAEANPQLILDEHSRKLVLNICLRLDGIPLAIELAAGCLRIMGLQQINQHLADRFTLLDRGYRNALPRQQTLQALFDWSYDLLDEDEREIFTGLAVFVGSFTLEAVVAVMAGVWSEAATRRLLTQLVDKSLLTVIEQGEQLRYQMLETVREYAHLRLVARGKANGASARQLAYYCRYAAEADTLLRGEQQGLWLSRMELDHDNFRAALAYAYAQADGESSLRLACDLRHFWEQKGYIGEGSSHLRRALTLAHAVAPVLRARAYTELSALESKLANYQSASELQAQSLAIYLQLGDTWGQARSLNLLGNLACYQGSYPAARGYYEQALAHYRSIDDELGVANVLNNIANLLLDIDELAAARPLYEESLAIRRAHGQYSGVADLLNNMGSLAYASGEFERAGELYQQALEVYRGLGAKLDIALALSNLAHVLTTSSQFARALALYQESIRLRAEMEELRGLCEALDGLAQLAIGAGHMEVAAFLLAAVEAQCQLANIILSPSEQQRVAQSRSQVQSALAPDTFQCASARGAHASLDQIVSLVANLKLR